MYVRDRIVHSFPPQFILGVLRPWKLGRVESIYSNQKSLFNTLQIMEDIARLLLGVLLTNVYN